MYNLFVGSDFKARLTAGGHHFRVGLITISDCRYGLSPGHDFSADLDIMYGLSQCMILGMVLTHSYDCMFGLSAGHDFMSGLRAIYDCRSGLFSNHDCRAGLTSCYNYSYIFSASYVCRSSLTIIYDFRAGL
jgi:hypothetical protein